MKCNSVLVVRVQYLSPIDLTRSLSDDLERRASVEYGEDPLTNDLDTPSGDRSVVALASPTPENAKSRDEDDNVFLTNDSWLELRGRQFYLENAPQSQLLNCPKMSP